MIYNSYCRYVSQICSGCQYIHHKGILHRDLKLGNMFLTSEDVVKIGDFGLAITMEKPSNLNADMNSGTLCGTPNYIAPEVLLKKGHRKHSDYWAIGCMTFALLIGHPPFETESLKQVGTPLCCFPSCAALPHLPFFLPPHHHILLINHRKSSSFLQYYVVDLCKFTPVFLRYIFI